MITKSKAAPYNRDSCFPGAVVLIALLAMSSAAQAGFDLLVGPQIGIKTGVPSDTSLVFAGFAAVAILPSLQIPLHSSWSFAADLECSPGIYFQGSHEMIFDPHVSIIHEGPVWTQSCLASGGYFFLPSIYEPGNPQEYANFSLAAELTKKTPGPWSFGMAISALNDLDTNRTDARLKLWLKKKFRLSRRMSLSVRPGLTINASTNAQFSSTEPLLAGGVSWVINDAYSAVAQVSFCYPVYWIGYAPQGIGRKSRSPLVEVPATASRIPRIVSSMIVSRELTPRLDANLSYDFICYDPGTSWPIYSSHKLGLALEWRLLSL